MKILLLHCDWVEWEPTKKAIKSAEDIADKKAVRVEDCLVVLTSVEKGDEKDPEKSVLEYIKNIKDVAEMVKAKNIVVYPYAHLSSNLSSVEIAQRVLGGAEKELTKDFKVWRAPFGWYKKLSLSAKGHPLSELSRDISVDSGLLKDGPANDTYRKLIKLLDENKANYRLIDHPPEGRTEVVSPMRGNKISQAAKCIIVILKIEKSTKYVLSVVPGDAKVDLDALKKLFGASYASFATQEIAERLAGSVSGTVLPLSFNPEMELIVDPSLLKNEEIFFNAARLDQSMALKTNDYTKLAKPRLEKIATYSAQAGQLFSEPQPGGATGKVEEIVSEALKKEKEELVSEWFILESTGKENKIELKDNKISGFNFSKNLKLEKFVKYELAKNRAVDIEPPHIKLMKKLQLVGHEEGSDPGNLRFLPNGRLIKSLIEDWVTKKTVEYGAVEVETPIMYDFEHPALKSYLNRFPARQYSIQTPNKKVFLRFAACFGQFLMAKDASISYKNLPLPMYELTRYSFRVEQRGELAGLRRLRAFTMPDCHCFVKDFEQAKKEMVKRIDLAKKIQEGIGFNLMDDFEYAIRVTKDFFEAHKDFVIQLVKEFGKPVLLEVWNKRFFYFVLKYEWNFVDALDKAATLTTDQIDVENAERYGIQYTDFDNTRKYPLILHLSPTGAVERVIYALLERADAQQKEGKHPILPIWLSPTQIRLCPVNDEFNKWADELANKIAEQNIRIDIDDNSESIQKKIRDSEVDWVPYTVVLGQKEKESGKLAVRFREDSKIRQMSLEELISLVKKQVEGMPFKPLSLARHLTRRPVFVA